MSPLAWLRLCLAKALPPCIKKIKLEIKLWFSYVIFRTHRVRFEQEVTWIFLLDIVLRVKYYQSKRYERYIFYFNNTNIGLSFFAIIASLLEQSSQRKGETRQGNAAIFSGFPKPKLCADTKNVANCYKIFIRLQIRLLKEQAYQQLTPLDFQFTPLAPLSTLCLFFDSASAQPSRAKRRL